MANNNALFNAALSGITGGCQTRWLTQREAGDFTNFRNAVVVAATIIDSLIDPIDELNYASVRLLQSICQGVYTDRMITNLSESDYAVIAQSIVALWTELRSLETEEPITETFTPDTYEGADDFTSIAANPTTTTTQQSAIGETNWNFYDPGGIGELRPISDNAYALKCMGVHDLTVLSGNTGKVGIIRGPLVTADTNGWFQAKYLSRFEMILSAFNSGEDGSGLGVEVFCGVRDAFYGTTLNEFGLIYSPNLLNENWHIQYRRSGGSPVNVDTGVRAQSPQTDFPLMQQLRIDQENGVWIASIASETVNSFEYSQAIDDDSNTPDLDSIVTFGVTLENLSALSVNKRVPIDWAHWKLANLERLLPD